MVLCLCVCCRHKVEEQWIRRMSEQQSAPEQLAAGKSQGGAGATYKVLEATSRGLIREGALPFHPTLTVSSCCGSSVFCGLNAPLSVVDEGVYPDEVNLHLSV